METSTVIYRAEGHSGMGVIHVPEALVEACGSQDRTEGDCRRLEPLTLADGRRCVPAAAVEVVLQDVARRISDTNSDVCYGTCADSGDAVCVYDRRLAHVHPDCPFAWGNSDLIES